MARLEDLINLSPEEIRAMGTKEFRKVTQQLADAANKRIKRLLSDEEGKTSPVFAHMNETGKVPYFSVKGKKTKREIKNEYKRLKNFLRPGKKTSSLREWKKVQNEIYKRIGIKPSSEMWKAYRELERTYGGQFPGGYGSEDVQRILVNAYNAGNRSTEDLYRWAELKMTEAYEHGQFSDDDGEDPFDFEDFFDI